MPATCEKAARRVAGFQDQWIRAGREGLQTFLLKGRHRKGKDDAKEMHFTTLYLQSLEKLLKYPELGWSIFQIEKIIPSLFYLSPTVA